MDQIIRRFTVSLNCGARWGSASARDEISRAKVRKVRTRSLAEWRQHGVDGSEGRELRRTGLALVRDVDDSDALPLPYELLSHDDEEVRVMALASICPRLSHEQLLEVVRAYMAKGTY
jgi:hypothetical protein